MLNHFKICTDRETALLPPTYLRVVIKVFNKISRKWINKMDFGFCFKMLRKNNNFAGKHFIWWNFWKYFFQFDCRALSFLYPYGATLNIAKPAVAVLSSGSVSFPLNRPVCAFYLHPVSLFWFVFWKFFALLWKCAISCL